MRCSRFCCQWYTRAPVIRRTSNSTTRKLDAFTITVRTPAAVSGKRGRLFSSTTTFRSSSSQSLLSTVSTPSSQSFDHGPVHDRYYEVLSSNSKIDPIQIRTLQSLERLRSNLLQHPPLTLTKNATTSTARSGNKNTMNKAISHISNWFGFQQPDQRNVSSIQKHQQQQYYKPPKIQGVYIHGGVGCGKTFLMNEIFYESLHDTEWEHCRQKTHFHTFMLNIHQQLHLARKQQNHSKHKNDEYSSDTIFDNVVRGIVQKGRLICFDEFQVTDVADALLLQRLFTALWEDYNCIVVATSNRPPDDLYLNGLQRDRFVPFIHQLKVYCQSISMWDSEYDYRLLMASQRLNETPTTLTSASNNSTNNMNTSNRTTEGSKSSCDGVQLNGSNALDHNRMQQVYYVGGKIVWKKYDRFFYHLIGLNKAVSPTTIQTQGRTIHIPQAALSKGICRFSFESLCTKALGAGDYLVLGHQFHTIFVDNIPILKLEHLNWVRRFILFVDAMYECHCKLVLHLSAEPQYIFRSGLSDDEMKTTEIDEVFAFQRTVSRLYEMASPTYLQKQQKLHDAIVVNDNVDMSEQATGKIMVDSKAGLLSHRKAFVSVTPS